jgi:C1A family cysteine protease
MLSDVDKRLKVICSLVMLAAIALTPLAGVSDLQAQEDDTFHLSPLNPDFVKFWEERPEPFCGYIPPPMDLSHLDAIPMGGLLKSGAPPTSFDWRDQGGVTSIKNQLSCGTCWIFGTTSILESAVLIGEDTEYNFSEQSVALCVDRSWVYLYDDADEPCGIAPSHGGGWSSLASEVFIKKGAVLESCNPYNSSGLQCNGACLCDNCTPVKRVNGYRYVTDDQSQTDLIKEVVYSQGPVTVAFHYGAHQYTDATYGTVYDCAACPPANHMVSIIGWDDSVPHFETSGTGAWLVKNSWGAAWGNSGYFWLAYNSSSMEEIAYLEYKDYDPNEKLYYWDEAGMVGAAGCGAPSAWMANIFTSTQDGSLTHVDFWTTSNDAQYDIYVYLDGDISNGLQNQVASQTGICQEFGYYSIPLTSPVSLPSGQPFTIAVKMTTPGYNYPIPVEKVIGGFVEPMIQGEVSYARCGDVGAWDDIATIEVNACLRARVTSGAAGQPDITVAPPSFNVTLPPDIIQNYTLTIGNVGDATLTYNISDRETTGEGSTVGVESPALKPASALSTGAQVVLNPTSDVQKALSNRVLTEVLKSERTASGLESASFYSKDAYWEGKIPRLVITTELPGDCPWLDENPKSGTVEPSGSDNITVDINTIELVPGDYSAEIVIDNNDLDDNPTTVPVTLHISGVVVSIDATTVGSGETAALPINITDVTDLGLATIWLSYDKDVVTVDSVADGDMGTVIHAIYNDDGVTRMTCQNAYGISGDFVFAQVTLHAATTSVDLTSPLDLDVIEFVDTSFNPIVPTVTDGTFNIDATGPTCTIGVDTDPICDSDLVQEITVTYNATMSATPSPTIAFATTTGTWTSNGDGAWTGGQTVWTESFTITDADEEITDVDVSASGAEDTLGNTQTACTAVDAFDVDTKNPTVTSTSPADGATAVAADAAVNATFSEAIVVGANITAVSISPDPGGVVASVVGGTNLNIAHNNFTGPAYNATIPAGAVKDGAGNPNSEYSWSFTRLMEGDANLDNCVSGADALVIAQYVVYMATLTENQATCADTTDDGNVTGADALHIGQWIVDPYGGGGVLKKPLWESPADDDMRQPEP